MRERKPKPRASLREILRHRDPEVVLRFAEDWRVSKAEARKIFDDLVRYFWLQTTSPVPTQPVRIIDEMWHTFLLFGRSYEAWCTRFFGRTLYHQPTLSREKRAARRLVQRDRARAYREAHAKLTEEMRITLEGLGRSTLLRWYRDYMRKYGDAFMSARRPRLS